MIRPALRRGLAENAVARHGVSIALACRTFDVSETCYRYSPHLSDENEEIADLLVGLTAERKTWGFGLCFLHLLRTELADQTSETVKAGQTRCAVSAGCTELDLVDGLHGGSPRGWSGVLALERAG